MVNTEPQFEVYDTSREDVPTIDESHNGDVFDSDSVTADVLIVGYDNLCEFLNKNQKTVTVYSERLGQEIEGEVGMFRWSEVGVEHAPSHEFCYCGAKIQTRSPERLHEVTQCHQIETGH